MANQIAYGFEQFATRMADRVTTIGVTEVDDAITQSMAEHNRQLDAITSALVERTEEFQRLFKSPAMSRNQPLDEHGDPLPIRSAGHYQMAWPIQDSGNAIGWNWQTGVKQTVQEVNDQIVQIQQGDVQWMMDHILGALFTNTAYTFNDTEHGPLTIASLANGDTVNYQVRIGDNAGATDNHYLAQANAIDAGNNPFPLIYDDLTEHPENGNGQVIVFIPTNLKASVSALSTFHPVLPTNAVTPGDQTARLTGTLGVNVPGKVIGYEDSGCWIVEWRRLPSNYMIAYHTGGPAPIRQREDTAAELRGFVEMPASGDFPYTKRRWLRKAGFGGWNRVGAVVYRIGNAAYAIPTNYSMPMA